MAGFDLAWYQIQRTSIPTEFCVPIEYTREFEELLIIESAISQDFTWRPIANRAAIYEDIEQLNDLVMTICWTDIRNADLASVLLAYKSSWNRSMASMLEDMQSGERPSLI